MSTMSKLVAESLDERIKGRDDEGHKYGSKKSHWDKQGFRKFDSERTGKESYKGDVVSLLKHDHYEYDVKENKTPEDEAVLAYIERIASWLDIELNESINEYEKPGTKKRKLEDGILALYSSNVPDYKIGELKTRAAEAMQEEYDRGYHEGSSAISSGLSMD